MCHVQDTLGASQNRACKAVGQPRSTQRYEPVAQAPSRVDLVARMHELAVVNPRYGYRRIHALLAREGCPVGRGKVRRIWREEDLKVPQKQRKRKSFGSAAGSCIVMRPARKGHVWSLDFIHDSTEDGRQVKAMPLIDEYTRECLALHVGRSIKSHDVIDVLAAQVAMRGAPDHIRCDNGPEFVAGAIKQWLARLSIKTLYIEPGAPWQNGYVESFNDKLRDELTKREVFVDLAHACSRFAWFRDTYNHHRPHSSLGYMTPSEFANQPPDRLGPSALAGQVLTTRSTRTLIVR